MGFNSVFKGLMPEIQPKTYFARGKVSFISDQSQLNLRYVQRKRGESEV